MERIASVFLIDGEYLFVFPVLVTHGVHAFGQGLVGLADAPLLCGVRLVLAYQLHLAVLAVAQCQVGMLARRDEIDVLAAGGNKCPLLVDVGVPAVPLDDEHIGLGVTRIVHRFFVGRQPEVDESVLGTDNPEQLSGCSFGFAT